LVELGKSTFRTRFASHAKISPCKGLDFAAGASTISGAITGVFSVLAAVHINQLRFTSAKLELGLCFVLKKQPANLLFARVQ